jgi:uncharacterized repeat protein (TIGR03803 family)
MTPIAQNSEPRLRAVSVALALAIVLLPALVATRSAQGQTFTVLYSFTGGADGAETYAGLILDAAGNLYGATYWGGASGGFNGYGTVFKLAKTGKETALYTFTGGSDGAHPAYEYLVRDAAGNLYGTTAYGGAYTGDNGYGTVLKVDKTNKETVLYTFTGGSDGANPYAGLVRDAAGNLYGTTLNGGASGLGTVFKLNKAGKETVLHSFTGGGGDGSYPYAGLVRDAKGNLYGTAYEGGSSGCYLGYGCGVVFKVDATGKETVLYAFTGTGGDGGFPDAGLVRDTQGNLYGTTAGQGASGYGTVFKLDKKGKETVLYSFTGTGGDGAYPYSDLVRDAMGNLYGTTSQGGGSGAGTVFKLDKTGNETVLYSFTGGDDGYDPWAGLVRDTKGNLYGTTVGRGAYGWGTVFKLTP